MFPHFSNSLRSPSQTIDVTVFMPSVHGSDEVAVNLKALPLPLRFNDIVEKLTEAGKYARGSSMNL
jgi:hypothetical protein